MNKHNFILVSLCFDSSYVDHPSFGILFMVMVPSLTILQHFAK